MEAFLSSTFGVFIAEIGDKTQLLTLFLAARFAEKCRNRRYFRRHAAQSSGIGLAGRMAGRLGVAGFGEMDCRPQLYRRRPLAAEAR